MDNFFVATAVAICEENEKCLQQFMLQIETTTESFEEQFFIMFLSDVPKYSYMWTNEIKRERKGTQTNDSCIFLELDASPFSTLDIFRLIKMQ